MKLICPKCGSYNINQYRMMHGPIWCESCGHEAKHKELYNPFVYYEPQPPQQQDLPTRLREVREEVKRERERTVSITKQGVLANLMATLEKFAVYLE